ncbi:MAG: glycosyltransferase family 39 protein [Oscillospiraceae bacterium]|nr:glycosyltransferase family 39 protein [Oscillospiraceae bacterium]
MEYAPPGLNQDEASSGYEAWAILHYGIDRNGDTLPVLLTSWGSGQNALYSYLAMPFIALFGLSVFSTRLPAAVIGSVSLIIAYLLGKRSKDDRFALLLMLAFALNPWHLTISRWALESNILPFFILLAIYGAALWDDDNRKYAHILTAAALGLSLYTYGTAFVWAPLFAIGIAVRKLIIAERKSKTLIEIATAFVVFSVIAFPIALCNLRNILGLPEMKLLWFTLPKLTETRQAATMNFDVIGNAKRLIEILWTQSDGLPWNSVPGFGLMFGKIGMAFVLLGIISTAVYRERRAELPLIALCAAIVTALFVDANINRVNVLLIPLVYFQAEGIIFLISRIKHSVFVLVPALIICGTVFCVVYFTSYRESLRPYFESKDNMPYIYVLFEGKVPPSDFADSVEYLNPDGAFRWPGYFEWKTDSGKLKTYAQ